MAEKQSFMNVTEVAKELGISESHAYKIMRKLNAELKEKGYMIIAGILTRRLNVKAGELLGEYGIEYTMKRTRNVSSISLTRKAG